MTTLLTKMYNETQKSNQLQRHAAVITKNTKKIIVAKRQVDLQGKTLDRHDSDISTVSYFMRKVSKLAQAGGNFLSLSLEE
jgi:hypothetical protein